MNFYKNKLNQIRVMLGMDVKMVESVLEDGVTRVETESLEPGFELFVVSEAGEKAPAPEGQHKLEDGTKVTVDAEGKITLVEKAEEPKVEVEVEAGKQKMSSDELADGTKIETAGDGEFKVGDQLSFITESGEKVAAPAGEHTTKSGITIVTDGEGKITGVKYPDKPGTGSLEKFADEKVEEIPAEMVAKLVEEKLGEKMDEIMQKVYAALEEVVKEVTEVKEEMAAQKEKMAKLSKAPGAPKISTFNTDVPTGTTDSLFEARLEALKNIKSEFGKNKRF
jgi:hypothetical protein